MLFSWLNRAWKYAFADECYEAHLDLPIEVVWKKFHEVVNTSGSIKPWGTDMVGTLHNDYLFQLERIIGDLSPDGQSGTFFHYRVIFGLSLALPVLGSLGLGSIILYFLHSVMSDSIARLSLALLFTFLLPAVQILREHRRRLDFHNLFIEAFAIRPIGCPCQQ